MAEYGSSRAARKRLSVVSFMLVNLALESILNLGVAGNVPSTEPDYCVLVRRFIPVPVETEQSKFVARIEHKPLRRFSEETAVIARLWRLSGRREYAENARKRLAALVEVWKLQRQPGRPWKRMCFFSVYPILDAYRILAEDKRLDAEFQDQFREFAREACFPLETGPFNQAFARAAGLALAAKTFADLPESTMWRKAAEGVWDEWYRQRDTTENAACYNGISLTFLFLLGDALGRTDRFQDEGVRKMFERYRDQVAPSGAMPEYGDSGDARWAMFHCWGHWVAAMERAAKIYNDPTYRWVAVRMYQAACRHAETQRAPSPVDGMPSAYGLCLADQWRDVRLQPRAIDRASVAAVRREPSNERAWDKLILAPSRQSGAAFVMAELFARSYHAHEDQLGAVLYYEDDGEPLLHGLGYHNRAAEQGNLVLLAPPGEPFPHKARTLTPDVWNEASLPAKRLPPLAGDGPGKNLRHFDKLTFRVAEDAAVELALGNLRLAGPKGEILLDDFRQQRGWRGGRQEFVTGPTPDSQALKVTLHPGTSFVWRAGFDRTFALQDYDRFKFSWKMQGTEDGWSKSLILRVDASPNDFHVALRPQTAEIVAARAEGRQGDQYGEFSATAWGTEDSRLTRRMLLLREGVLVVCDQLQPGRQADGWSAGPLWHLQSEPASGANWFDAAGRRNLLVWMSRSTGRTFGLQTAQLWSGVRPHTVFAKETLREGRPVQFITVLVPHAPDAPAADIAAGISMVAAAVGEAQINMARPEGKIGVRIDSQGKWSVIREKQARLTRVPLTAKLA